MFISYAKIKKKWQIIYLHQCRCRAFYVRTFKCDIHPWHHHCSLFALEIDKIRCGHSRI